MKSFTVTMKNSNKAVLGWEVKKNLTSMTLLDLKSVIM